MRSRVFRLMERDGLRVAAQRILFDTGNRAVKVRYLLSNRPKPPAETRAEHVEP